MGRAGHGQQLEEEGLRPPSRALSWLWSLPSAARVALLRGLRLTAGRAGRVTHCTNRLLWSQAIVNVTYQRQSIETFPPDSGLGVPALRSPTGRHSL